jgi:signal transduction histidine kinase/ligand-binding sensor domain-containing protein
LKRTVPAATAPSSCRFLFAAALLFLISLAASAQPGRMSVQDYHHTVWTARDGAPKDTWAIAQTRDGWLWFGGTEGLMRFDGQRFERVELDLGDASRSPAVASLFALSSGGLLIGRMDGGISRLEHGRFTHHDTAATERAGTVINFAQRADGSLWAATQGGLLQFTGSGWQPVADAGLPPGRIGVVYADRKSTLWVATRDRVHRLLQGGSRFETLPQRHGRILEIFAAQDGGLWLVDDQGVHALADPAGAADTDPQSNARMSHVALFDRDGVLWNMLGEHRPPGPREITDMHRLGAVKTITEDREGNLWFGDVGARIHRLRRPALAVLADATRDAGNTPWAGMATDASGMVWVARAQSFNTRAPAVDGLWRLDGSLQSVQPQQIGSATAIAHNAGRHVVVAGADGIWRSEGARFVLAAPLPRGAEQQIATAVSAATDGSLWLALEGAGLFRHDAHGWQRKGRVDGLPQATLSLLHHDRQDRLWIGYASGALSRVEHGVATALVTDAQHGLGAVRAISVGRHTVLGGDRGLAVLREGGIAPLRPSLPGVFANTTGLLEDRDGNLWVNADRGLVHLTAAELDRVVAEPVTDVATTLFGEEDGYPAPASNSLGVKPTLAQAGDGRIWVSAAGGIAWIDPRGPRPARAAPPVVLKTVAGKDFNTPLASQPQIDLPKGTRDLQIEYTALDFSHPERLRFRYRLEGLHDDWVQAEARREAFYANLAPGRYRFIVNVTDENGVWSNAIATLQIDIAPTFVQSRAFLVLCVAAALLLLLGLHRLRVRQLTTRERARMADLLSERERIARELHDTLLQSTQALMLRFGATARAMPLDPASDGMLHATLQSAEAVIAEGRDRIHGLRAVPLADGDVGRALSRLGQELSRQHGTPFASQVHGPRRRLPAVTEDAVFRIGREALRNAFGHAQACQVTLVLTLAADGLQLQVRDNGAGLPPEVQRTGAAPGHWGLPGMREQALRLGGTLRIAAAPGGGTLVECTAPLPAGRLRTWANRLRHLVMPRMPNHDEEKTPP